MENERNLNFDGYEIVVQLAKAWNNLDASYMEDILDENLVYDSQWVFESINGREDYLAYITGKFNSIRNSNKDFPSAEIAYFGNPDKNSGQPCLAMKQNDDEFLLMMKIEADKIVKMDMCMIPSVNSAVRFNIFPK